MSVSVSECNSECERECNSECERECNSECERECNSVSATVSVCRHMFPSVGDHAMALSKTHQPFLRWFA